MGYVKKINGYIIKDEAAQQSIQTLETTVSGHTSDIEDLETTVSNHTSGISALQTTVSSQATDIDNLETTVSNHTDSIGNLTNEVNLLSNRKFLFVGDSYGDGYTPDGMVTPWEDFVKDYLSISNNNFVKVTRGGAGFSTSLQTQFVNIIDEVQADTTITDVVICGGYNDQYSSCTEETIIAGITAVKTLCSTKFPNAKIHIGFIGNTSVTTDKINIFKKLPYYVKGCNINGISYLNNVQYALHNYYTEFSSDGIHPNETGQKEIAKAVSQALLTGSADVNKPFEALRSNLQDMGTRIINNLALLELRSNLDGNFTETSVLCDGSHYIEIPLEITNGHIVGNDKFGAYGYIHLIVLLTGNVYRDLDARLVIVGNKMRLYPQLINSAGNNFETLSFKGYQIRPFTLVMSSLDI